MDDYLIKTYKGNEHEIRVHIVEHFNLEYCNEEVSWGRTSYKLDQPE